MSTLSLESLAEAFRKKDAEIERLKAELDLSQNAVCDQISYAHKLIIELADLIDQGFGPSKKLATYKFRLRQAVKRAREANTMIDDNSVIEPEDQFGPPGKAYREIIREQKKVITELCDALEVFGSGRIPWKWDVTVQRAREATK